MIKGLSETEPVDELIQNHPLVLLQIGSAQCVPCHAISQRLEQWHKNYSYVEGKLFQRESGYFSLDQLLDRFTDIINLSEDVSAE